MSDSSYFEFESVHAVRKFNARNKSFEEVARTFEPPDRFTALADFCNTVVVGPRGSGKTTLLKMLHPAALGKWNDKRAVEIQDRVTYSGVYVPTDRLWQTQLENMGGHGLEDETRELLGRAVTVTQVLSAVVQTMMYRTQAVPGTFLAAELPADSEIALVRSLSNDWSLFPDIPTLGELLNSLQSRINRIYSIASVESLRGAEGRNERLADNPDLHQDFLTGLLTAISRFNNAVNETNRTWALLFDELEIAPKWLTERLFELLRSTDQRLLFKLSTSPVAPSVETFEDPTAPSEANDFGVIRLWHANKDEILPFTRRLLQRLLEELGMDMSKGLDSIIPAEQSRGARTKQQSYLPGGKHYNLFKNLSKSDLAFASYLTDKSIDLDKWPHMSENSRAQVRKFTPVAQARFLLLRESNSGHLIRRSKKRIAVDMGFETLCTVVEGNPRLLTQIVSGLWTNSEGKRSFRPVLQRRELSAAIGRYLKFLETVPVFGFVGKDGMVSAVDLVTLIGEYFEQVITDADHFSPQPHLSLRIDSKVDAELSGTLAALVNAGAVILVAEEGSGATTRNLEGQRCRLSYLLHAYFGLPFILGEEISLSQVFSRTNKERLEQSGLQLEFRTDE